MLAVRANIQRKKEKQPAAKAVDCSSSFAFMSAEEAREIIRAYGADKVLFGTDYPMWEYKAELERFKALGLTDEEERLILYKNAAELFGIEV